MEATVHASFSPATWRHLRSTWLQYSAFVTLALDQPAPWQVDELSAKLFIQHRLLLPATYRSKRRPALLLPQSALRLLTDLITVCRMMQTPHDELQLYAAGVRKRYSATKVRHGALPMSKPLLTQLLRWMSGPDVKAAAWLMWVTASRWDDVFRLRECDVMLEQRGGGLPPRLLVVFPHSKANPEGKTRSDHVVLIDTVSRPPNFLLAAASAAHSTKPVFKPRVACALRKYLRCLRVPPNYMGQFLQKDLRFRDHFTLHSIKRGAVTELLQMAADGLIGVEKVSQMAKHRCAVRDLAPDTITGYCARRDLLARALQTDVMTRFLDPGVVPDTRSRRKPPSLSSRATVTSESTAASSSSTSGGFFSCRSTPRVSK
jgi:hypothetical protein